jgi:hypothetical protein
MVLGVKVFNFLPNLCGFFFKRELSLAILKFYIDFGVFKNVGLSSIFPI